MTDEELLEYFMFRIAETDEVWGLKAGPRWITREIEAGKPCRYGPLNVMPKKPQ